MIKNVLNGVVYGKQILYKHLINKTSEFTQFSDALLSQLML